ncbi:MAG: ABC-2 family transporter protein [Clostridia bacterium]|nr:ABC-2 family transporter protein [Clostridia bacterium]
MQKYLSIFKYSLKMNMTFIFDYVFSTISFAIHMLVFSCLWDFILKDGSMYGYDRNELIWYVIIAEFITYSASRFYKKISDMVKDGTIANLLIKPINVLTYILCEQSADVLKVGINLIAAMLLGVVLADPIKLTFVQSLLVIASCILSFVISTFIQFIIGLIAFYIEETKSIWFIVQKVQFLLVFVPIEFYSEFVQKLLMLSPTTHMIYAPGTILVDFEQSSAISAILMQMIMIGIMAVSTLILYKKGVKKINVNGG